MTDYNSIIALVIKESLPEVIEKYLPNVKYTNRKEVYEIINPTINFIYYEYKNNKVEFIINRIHELSGKNKIFIKKDYDEIKNDHIMFKNRLRNEIILYLKNNK